MTNNRGSSNRGFGAMDDARQREISSRGGRSVPGQKRSFSQDRELAAEAGRKGGEASGRQQSQSGSSNRQQGGASSGGDRQQG